MKCVVKVRKQIYLVRKLIMKVRREKKLVRKQPQKVRRKKEKVRKGMLIQCNMYIIVHTKKRSGDPPLRFYL